MNYFIKRDLNEYGPYTLADLQKYVASGNILLTDLCRSEGLTDWVPVSQVIGNIPVPAAPQPAPQTVYGGTAPAYGAPAVSPYPPPPNLHWGICLLLAIVTCGVFGWVWIFVQAAWLKKVQPNSKGIIFFASAFGVLALTFAAAIAFAASGNYGRGNQSLLAFLVIGRLAFLVLVIAGSFSMRNSIEEHYNSAEPIGLSLSGILTFVFGFFFVVYIYFQYHFTQINEMKRRQMGYA